MNKRLPWIFLMLLCIISLPLGAVTLPRQPDSTQVNPDVVDIENSTVAQILAHALRCEQLGMYDKETDVLEQLKYSGKTMTETERIRCLYILAYGYYGAGNFQLSLSNLFEMFRIPKADSLKYYDLSGQLILTSTYMRCGAVEQADSVLEKIRMELNKSHLPEKRLRNLWHDWYLDKSMVYAERSQWTQYLETMKNSEKYDDSGRWNTTLRKLNYGIYYMRIGDTPMAEAYFKQLITQPEWSYDKIAGLTNYSQMLFNEHRYEDAEKMAALGLDLISDNGMEKMRAKLLWIRGMALHALGKSGQGIPMLNESMELRDSMAQWHMANSVLASVRDMQRALEEGNVSEKPAHSATPTGYLILVVGLLIAVLALILIYRKYVCARRDGASLRHQLETLESRHQATIDSTLTDLSDNNRRMVALTLKHAQLNELLREAVNDPENAANAEERLRHLHEGIKEFDLNRNVWETFDILFEQTQPDFYTGIRERHPDLTKGELRMCAYILMNLSAKEIARITSRSIRTVESVKYRLRKKLNLPEGSDLTSYLHSFAITKEGARCDSVPETDGNPPTAHS